MPTRACHPSPRAHPPQPPAAGPDGLHEPDVRALELHGRRLRIVCVDGVEPQHQSRPGSSRPQYVYQSGEIAHFDIGHRRYALVPDGWDAAALAQDPAGAGRDPRQLLTGRELQIVQLICMGLLTKQVADRLHLSEFTVRSYLKTIYCKLGVRSRGGMVYAFAKAFGLSVQPGLHMDDAP